MAKKTSQELYTRWSQVIKASLQFRNKIISEEDFKVYSNYYKGRFWQERKKGERVEVNMVYSTTNLMMSALASRDPWIAFKARKDELKNRECLCEEALNNSLVDIGFRFTLQEVIRDAQLYGYGVIKTGYTYEAEEQKVKKVKDVKDVSDTAEEKDKVDNIDKQAEQPEYHLQIKKDAMYANLVDPRKLLLDPTSMQSIRDSKFVIEVLMQNKDFLGKKYGVDLSKVTVGIPAFLKDKFDSLDKECQRVFDMCIFYEIWDIVERKRYIMIEGYAEKFFEYDWPYSLDEYPYELLIFNHSPNEPYGISDVALYRTQQEELNTLRSQEAEHTKKNNARWQFVGEKAELKEVKKFMANETGSVIQVKGENAITPIQPHQMTQDFSLYESRIQNDIQETLGIADFMRAGGGAGKGKKTATEAYSTDFFARLRLGQRQAEVDNFVLGVAKKLFCIMQQEYDTQHIVQLVGADGKYISKEFTKKDLDGEFDMLVQQGTGASNKSYQAQMVSQGIQYLQGNPLINPKELTDIIVDVYFDGLDVSKLIIPNAEQIANDPIAREQYRQIMLMVAAQGALKQATNALMQTQQGAQQQPAPGQKMMPGGNNPVPGNVAPPPQAPHLPAGGPPVPGIGA